MARVPLTKADIRERLIPLPINRGWAADYYEEDGQVFCRRAHQGMTEVMVVKLGRHPVFGNVCVYWDSVG